MTATLTTLTLINWLTSYSLYANSLGKWFNENVNAEWTTLRGKIIALLSEEAQLEEMVKLVGMDSLSPADRLKMEAARSIREDFLHQLAFHEIDTYTSSEKQYMMMKLVVEYYEKGLAAIEEGKDIEDIVKLPVREKIGRFKYIAEDIAEEEFRKILAQLENEINESKGGQD